MVPRLGAQVTRMQRGNAMSLQGAAGVSDNMLLVLVRPASTGERRGPAPGGTDHPPGGMAVMRYD